MAWFLTVSSGPDESQQLTIAEGECSIGRAPTSGFVLHDETVAWEHARVRVDGDKLFLSNLSSLGTYVKGRRITDEHPLNDGDEITLSDSSRMVVKSKHGSSAGASSLTVVLLLIVLLVAAAGAATFMMDDAPPPPPRAGTQHWTQAYQRIEDRLEEWTQAGRLPEEIIDLYRDAWRLEKADNLAAATPRWQALRSSLLTLSVPFRGSNGPTFAQEAGPTASSLSLVMGMTSGDQAFDWNSDEVIADAFVWFVRKRTERAEKKAGESP